MATTSSGEIRACQQESGWILATCSGYARGVMSLRTPDNPPRALPSEEEEAEKRDYSFDVALFELEMEFLTYGSTGNPRLDEELRRILG